MHDLAARFDAYTECTLHAILQLQNMQAKASTQ
jgi:hypothetical protein